MFEEVQLSFSDFFSAAFKIFSAFFNGSG